MISIGTLADVTSMYVGTLLFWKTTVVKAEFTLIDILAIVTVRDETQAAVTPLIIGAIRQDVSVTHLGAIISTVGTSFRHVGVSVESRYTFTDMTLVSLHTGGVGSTRRVFTLHAILWVTGAHLSAVFITPLGIRLFVNTVWKDTSTLVFTFTSRVTAQNKALFTITTKLKVIIIIRCAVWIDASGLTGG